MKKIEECNGNENIIEVVKKAIVEKKEWVRKVQTGQVTYTKGRKIA